MRGRLYRGRFSPSCTLPAFATAGMLLTSILLALVSFQSYMTSTFVLEACARAEWLERFVGPGGGNANEEGSRFVPRRTAAPAAPDAEAATTPTVPIPDTIATTTNHTPVTIATSDDDDNNNAEIADPAKEVPAQTKGGRRVAHDGPYGFEAKFSSGGSSIQHDTNSEGAGPSSSASASVVSSPPTATSAARADPTATAAAPTPTPPASTAAASVNSSGAATGASAPVVPPHRSTADSSRASYYGYEAAVMDTTAQSMLSSMANSSDGAAGDDAERGDARSPYVERRANARRRQRRQQQGSHVHGGGRSIATASTWSRRSSVKIRARKFELSLLQQLFLGKWWNYLFTATTALDLYGLTWAFCSIFGAALSDQLPIASISWNYELWVLVFVAVAIPLSCTSILDQLYVQLAFLMLRLLMVFFMITTLLVALANPSQSYFADQVGPNNNLPLANWRGLIQATTTCVFATAFQFSVPAVGHVTNNKRVLSRIFVSAVGFVFASNLLLALLIAVYFGSSGQSSSNLNWAMYEASPFLSRYITLFAAIDGIAVYPLIAISLGGILMGAVYGDDMMEAELDWKRRTAFRFVASVPQAVGALFVRDLGVIALYTGIVTIVSYTIAPSMLCIASYQRMSVVRATTSTVYSTLVSEAVHVKLARVLIVLSVLLIVGVIVDSFFPVASPPADG
jgi:hypothetical protein